MKPSMEFLQSELNRTSEFIRFADSKAAFIFTIYSILLAILTVKFDIIKNSQSYIVVITYLLAVILFMFGIRSLVLSTFPRTKNNNTKKSFFFFKHIAKLKLDDFIHEYSRLSEDEIKNQITEQIHATSKIASIKMRHIQKSIIFLLLLVATTALLHLTLSV